MTKLVHGIYMFVEISTANLKIMAYQRRISMSKCVVAMVDKTWKDDKKVYDCPRLASFIDKLVKNNPQVEVEGKLRNLKYNLQVISYIAASSEYFDMKQRYTK